MNKNQILGWIVIGIALVIFVILYMESYQISKQNPNLVFKDFNGNEYRTVRIGRQVWMAENLRSTKASDGSAVKNYVPRGDQNIVETYGRLYEWKDAMKLCPQGWHLPTENDWKILGNFLGSHAGAKLKDTLHWKMDSPNTTNQTNFSARPSGYSTEGNNELSFGIKAVYWSSTAKDSNHVWCRVLLSGKDSLYSSLENSRNAYSVRCIRN